MSISPVHAILAQAQQVGDDIVAELQQAAGVPIEGGVDERSLQERLDALDILLANAKEAGNIAEAERLVQQAKRMVAAERLEFERALSAARDAYNNVRDEHGENSAEAAQAAGVEEDMRQKLSDFDTYQKLTDAAYDEALVSLAPASEAQPAQEQRITEQSREERLQAIADKLEALKREFEEEFERIKHMAPTAASGPSDDERRRRADELLEKMKADLE
ncbi:MAG: hypothetical protein IT405_02350 [Candidatus Yanofskybacteria bacterium]|nr:hypothetical protein [Candidatus Yanofskybacteria bacterium]